MHEISTMELYADAPTELERLYIGYLVPRPRSPGATGLKSPTRGTIPSSYAMTNSIFHALLYLSILNLTAPTSIAKANLPHPTANTIRTVLACLIIPLSAIKGRSVYWHSPEGWGGLPWLVDIPIHYEAVFRVCGPPILLVE